MPQILTSTIRFPEISLATRDAHKLRGYFGEYFKEHSPLLHNHYEDGSSRYRYPLVQYKVINAVPILVGINDGAELLTSLFLKISELDIGGEIYPVYSKNISQQKARAEVVDDLQSYRFSNYWMALNTENYKQYIKINKDEQGILLNQILRNNLLSFFKGVGIWVEKKIMAKGDFQSKTSKFKDQKMMVFEGEFVSNVVLPDLVGLGKSVARGFGAIKKIS
ncbi:MAG: CRISPR-associated endonuclease Cas6 [Candidatus Paceibacterota bacterium]